MSRPETTVELDQKEIDVLLKYFPNGIVALDLEMTGLSASLDKIIEFAAVKLTPDRKVATFHSLINPLIPIPEATQIFHGLTDAMVQDAPTLKPVMTDFEEFLGEFPYIGHSVQFDASFIVSAYHQFNLEFKANEVYDSCKFGRAVFKNVREDRPENFKLSGLAEHFEIKFSHHQALDDAVVSLKIYARCLLYNQTADVMVQFKDASYHFKMTDFRRQGSLILPKKFEVLREKLIKRELIEIKYRGGNHGNDWRAIKPIALLNTPGGLILYAECQISNLNKTFAIKKILKIKGLVE